MYSLKWFVTSKDAGSSVNPARRQAVRDHWTDHLGALPPETHKVEPCTREGGDPLVCAFLRIHAHDCTPSRSSTFPRDGEPPRAPDPSLPVLAAAIAALCGLTLSTASATSSVIPRPTHDFDSFLRHYEAANTAFVNGDPSRWLAMTALKDPVSIFGGFGGLGDAGTAAVHQRYLLAATAFRPSGAKVEFQYLVKDVQGRLAYTVAIERSNVLYAGQSQRRPQILRVTMLFRRDLGGWKIIRHDDRAATAHRLNLLVPHSQAAALGTLRLVTPGREYTAQLHTAGAP